MGASIRQGKAAIVELGWWAIGTLYSTVSCAEAIEVPFGIKTLVDTRDNVLDGGADPPMEWDILVGE